MSQLQDAWTPRQKVLFWSVVGFALLLPRVLLQSALPVYLFSDDSHSYLLSAFHWTQTGDWETSPRRGVVYSLWISGILQFCGNLNAVPLLQHLLGAASVALAIAVFRSWIPGRFFWIALIVAVAYSVAGFPIFFEQTVRSEVLLLLFSTIAIASWAWFLKDRADWLLLPAGIAFGLATLIKNLLLPFPFVVAFWLLAERTQPLLGRGRRILLLGFGCALPFFGNRVINHLSGHPPEAAPQSGILLYGRVAQWTALDSPEQAEIKQLIRADIEDYRKLPRLNNNVILKRTAVPHIAAWLHQRGGSRADLDRICGALAREAIRTHPGKWAEQVMSDFTRLHWKMKFPLDIPDADDLREARLSTTKMKHRHPMLQQEETLAVLGRSEIVGDLAPYHFVTSGAWLFAWHPVLLTSLLLPLLILLDREKMRRPFWTVSAALWFFNVAIICTVGRPIPRYLIATLPVMFWTLGGAVLVGYSRITQIIDRRRNQSASGNS